ncbi:hypothetical protein [Vibrio sp. B1Z05]|uniref:hypothetical protein n=1 Tax=Vibrio sp. B1Z05 TaxID=2654980 RepID=UPI00128B8573|nr:hypothetical protein [Vibrio sp. B1Z05]MPW37296.1 hypothetical protein [Vibrio sp. B1Z05]
MKFLALILLILLFFGWVAQFVIMPLLGYKRKVVRTPRYTTVRSHNRVGTRGVRSHNRRLADDVSYEWVKEASNKEQVREPLTTKHSISLIGNHRKSSQNAKQAHQKSYQSRELNSAIDYFGLSKSDGHRLILFSIDGKLRIFDRSVRSHQVESVLLFGNQWHEKLIFKLSDITPSNTVIRSTDTCNRSLARYIKETSCVLIEPTQTTEVEKSDKTLLFTFSIGNIDTRDKLSNIHRPSVLRKLTVGTVLNRLSQRSDGLGLMYNHKSIGVVPVCLEVFLFKHLGQLRLEIDNISSAGEEFFCDIGVYGCETRFKNNVFSKHIEFASYSSGSSMRINDYSNMPVEGDLGYINTKFWNGN